MNALQSNAGTSAAKFVQKLEKQSELMKALNAVYEDAGQHREAHRDAHKNIVLPTHMHPYTCCYCSSCCRGLYVCICQKSHGVSASCMYIHVFYF